MCWASNHQNIYRNYPRAHFPFSSQRNEVDLDKIDEEPPSTTLKNMSIGDVCPQEPRQVQYQPSSTQAQPPTQDEEQEAQDGGNGQGGVEE
jgi:hypothetical protein